MPGWRSSCAVILAIVLAGGHIAGLQVVAWTGMLLSRSASQGFERAMATTFDGQHPCSMCRAVSRLADAAPRDAAGVPPAKPDAAVKPPDLAPATAIASELPSGDWTRLILPPVAAGSAQHTPQPEPPPPRS